MCAYPAKWLCQIRKYINSPSYVTANMAAASSVNTGVKRDPIPLLNFFGPDIQSILEVDEVDT